ncbi:AbrB/MazE/SpoVT family DNA-binding domain-containing protein [Candidatus Pacearchaeota archaeon]|nr:AbrB/MazE/SpoVT family DNA-binding domain-containing protein [Candidatus Pacearchaeota archaeon]
MKKKEKLEITSISSRGQVVIPLGIREKLLIDQGDKFMVVGEGDTIILKKLQVPSIKDITKLIDKTKEISKPDKT